MKRLSDEFVESMRDLGWELDYSEESVQTLEEMVAAVQLPSGGWTSPPAKAQKRFLHGEEDNLVFYYQALSRK